MSKKIAAPRVRKKTQSIDIEKLVEETFDQVDSMFSLTSELGLSWEKAREIVKELIEIISSGYSSKPSPESIIKKIKRNASIFSEYIASKLIEIERPTIGQLEFIIIKGGRVALLDPGRLYKLATQYNREDLIALLRYNWNTHGSRGMIECPKCGFNSITSDKTCNICGYGVTDDYIKKSLNFQDKFEVYLKSASVAELNEVLQLGFVLLGELGIYSPKSTRVRIENIVYAVNLKRSEISKILDEVHSRSIPI